MDEHTLEKLEFARIAQWLAEHAQCALGRELAMKAAPSRRRSQVLTWLDQAREYQRLVDQRGLPPFGGIRNVMPQVRKAVPPAKLDPEEFADLAATLEGAGAVRVHFAELGGEFPHVARLMERTGDFRAVVERIRAVIDPRGRVRDDASERLQRVRNQINEIRQRTREVFDRLLKQPSVLKLLQFPNATFHADRMVLPLKSEQQGRVQGIIHRSSDSGHTLYVEPSEAVDLNNQRIRLVESEQEEINRILWDLTHLVHLNQKGILDTLTVLAVVDLLTAKVKMCRQFQMHFPSINEQHQFKLLGARNPVLMLLHEKQSGGVKPGDTTISGGNGTPASNSAVVPINVRLGEDFDVMVITGPNTGGKTATLKTVGLLTLMAQAGLPIPAEEGSTLPIFEGVWIDVGDEQSLEQSLSTFSAHLARNLDILVRAKKNTLVLLDEVGAGTDPDEGAAIGRAVVDRLLESECLAIITTHLGALKALGFEHKRVDNASVQFDIQTLRPTYELKIGEPGNSNAIAIASRLGMPKKMVVAAKKYLSSTNSALNRAINGTYKARRAAEQARLDAEKARQDAARATLAALDRQKELETLQQRYTQYIQRVAQLKPGDAVHVKRFDKPGKIVRVRLEKQTATVDLGTMQVDVPLPDLDLH